VPAGGVAVLYGSPGIGKLFLALDWANHIAVGREGLGRRVKRGDVFYVYAEGAGGLRSRENAWIERGEETLMD
jgi:RecA-family ATPase